MASLQDGSETCRYAELVAEPMRLELNFTFRLEKQTELLVLRELMTSDAVEELGVVGKNI